MSGPNRYTEGLIEIADVVASTTATNGEIRVNLGNATTKTGIDSNVPFWGTDGFLSRPLDPDTNGACQFVFFVDGNQRHAIGSRDRRFYDGLEAIDGGDRMIHAPSGIRIRLDDSEQTIELKIPGGTNAILAGNEFTVSIANGTTLDMSTSTVDVTKLGTAENVALYAALQSFLSEIETLLEIIVGDPIAVPPTVGLATILAVVPGGNPIATNLVAQLVLVKAAGVFALDSAIASSSVLRASPT